MSNKGHVGSCSQGRGHEEPKSQLGQGREMDYKERSEFHTGLRQEVQLGHGAAGMVFLFWPISDHRLELMELISTSVTVPALCTSALPPSSCLSVAFSGIHCSLDSTPLIPRVSPI